MAKPAELPEWDTDQTNATEPTSDRKADGWATNDIPTSGNLNWLFLWIYRWIKWIYDGVWEAISLAVESLTVSTSFTAGAFQLTADGQSRIVDNVAGPTIENQIASKNIIQASIRLVLNNSGTPTVDGDDQWNVSGCTAVGGGSNVIVVSWDFDFVAGTLPIITYGLQYGTSALYMLRITALSVSSCQLQLIDNTGTAVDPTGATPNGFAISLHATGRTAPP